MTTKSQMSSATLGSKNEDKTRKRKRPDSLDEDIMDRSKESQSRPGSVQRNRIARTQEDAESTIPTGRLSPSLFPKEDRMDLSKQLQSRQEIEHNKKLACKREDADNTILLDKMAEELLESTRENAKKVLSSVLAPSGENAKKVLSSVLAPSDEHYIDPFDMVMIKESSGEEFRVELGDNRNYAKEEKRFHLADLINAADDKPVVWAPPLPPPPPDPPNPN